MEWLKPSSVRSSLATPTSVRTRMTRPSCHSYQLGLTIPGWGGDHEVVCIPDDVDDAPIASFSRRRNDLATRFTPTRHSDIVHPVSSSQLTEARDRVLVRGYNMVLPAAC